MTVLSADLQIYDTLLKKWQKTVNLVSNTTLNDSATRHFEDSRQLLRYLPENAQTIYDLGSGAGFPGLVIAIERPEIDCHLIESNRKKCNFLTTVSRDLKLGNVTIHTARIEDMAAILPAPDVITARALAAVNQLLNLTLPWLKDNPNLRYLLLKGETAQQEIREANNHFEFTQTSHPSLTHDHGCVLDIQNVTPK